MTGPKITDKHDEVVKRVYLMRTNEDDIVILQGARIIGKLVWKKTEHESDKTGYSLG
jgi:hypothetical protein